MTPPYDRSLGMSHGEPPMGYVMGSLMHPYGRPHECTISGCFRPKS